MEGFFNGLHRELTKAVADFPKVGRTIDRHDYLFLLDQLVSEYNHFVMLADILEHVQKRKLTKRDLRQLPQEKKLGDIRRRYVTKGGAIGKAAVGFTEGGGAALFRVGAKLQGIAINQMTARAMKVIWNDEKDHYIEQAKIAARLIKTKKDMAAMQKAMIDVSAQRVWMRNEMFREPMTVAEIEAFIVRRRKKAAT